MLLNHGSVRRVAKRLVLGVLTSAALAGATTITTNTFNTWKSAAYQSGAPTGLNFLAINSAAYNTSSGVTLNAGSSAATFVGLNGPNYYLAGDVYAKTLASAAGSAASVSITFANPSNAFMIFFSGAATPYTFTLSDGQVFSMTTQRLGFSVSHNITSMSVSSTSGGQIVVNDFYFGVSSLAQDAPQSPDPGTPAATPEPATMMLMAGGVLVLVGAKKRWAKA